MRLTSNEGKNELIENIKILLYKYDSSIFDKIDYEDDDIYQEPLLYAYFNSKAKKIDLDIIIYGYTKEKLRPEKLKVKSDTYGKFYLPKIGWFITNENNKNYELHKTTNNLYTLYSKEVICNYTFEPIEIIKGTNIELLKYPVPLLEELYYDVDGSIIDVEIENITKSQRINIEKAFKLIKKLAPKHYKLIESITKKVVIFNVNTTLRNSFASLRAQGISFSNAYQKEYNEVFFIDDIAHQTGHLIFNVLIYNVQNFFKINFETVVEKLYLGNDTTETRSIHVVFHALYTYYTSFICLNAYLDFKVNDYDRNKHEAMGRMLFYIGKCYQDISLIENNDISKVVTINDIFTDGGIEIYLEIKNKYNSTIEKWGELLKGLNMSNQPYNFTYSKFLEINPLNEDIN
jgi:hypothetical protein|tara:strand:+ start:500 stop:1708 length:1209 start_codon:yes stop_codon:yes gene_type:complete